MKVEKIALMTAEKDKRFLVKLNVYWSNKEWSELMFPDSYETKAEALHVGGIVGSKIMSGEIDLTKKIEFGKDSEANLVIDINQKFDA